MKGSLWLVEMIDWWWVTIIIFLLLGSSSLSDDPFYWVTVMAVVEERKRPWGEEHKYTINDIETEIKRIYFITPWPDVRQDPQTVIRCSRARLDTMRIWGIRCIFLLSFCCPEDHRLLLLLLLPGISIKKRRDWDLGDCCWVATNKLVTLLCYCSAGLASGI